MTKDPIFFTPKPAARAVQLLVGGQQEFIDTPRPRIFMLAGPLRIFLLN